MMKIVTAIGALVGLFVGAPAVAQQAPAEPVQVMVLGTWHFDNPGLDLHNVRADDVLTPRRQSEIERVARAIAEFRPTRVMVERVARTPDLIDPNYAAFRPEQLRTQRDERVQLGYRVARLVGLSRVYAIDEQPGEGEPDYFPFGAVAEFAQANGQAAQLQQAMGRAAAETRAFEERQRTMSIAQLLIASNDPSRFSSDISGYYQTLGIGNTIQQPGAVLNAMWYMRNAKIFGKLMTVAEPGDRILVIFGTSHNYWLRHFASETPGYTSIDPGRYLRRAARR